MARRVLLAEGVLIGAIALGIFLREIPGLVREIRMWRMASFRRGPAVQRPRAT